jgi:hypothetical protein
MGPLYSRIPIRALAQVLGDVLVVAWTVWWWRTGLSVGALVAQLAEPGEQVAARADAVAAALDNAGDQAAGLPLVGDELAGPLRSAGEAMAALARAGNEQVAMVADLAGWIRFAVVAVPVGFALLAWAPPRLRFVRGSLAARRFARSPAGAPLMALRALTNQPLRALSRIDADPVGAWQRGDPRVVEGLARLELAAYGVSLRPVRTVGTDGGGWPGQGSGGGPVAGGATVIAAPPSDGW